MLETKSAPYTFVKQGIFYFSRRVPSDLSHHYNATRIMYSLRTRSAAVASARAFRAAQQLDEHWYHLRIRDVALPGKHLLRMASEPITPGVIAPEPSAGASVTLSDAVSIYLRLKGKGRPVTFHRAAQRSCRYVIDTCGDKDLTAYTKADATAFRDALLQRGLAGSSMTRVFGTVRTVFNFAASETGITVTNPFVGVYFDRRAGVEDRQPLPLKAILDLQARCRREDDDLRWIMALVSDTGMRLAEAAGLLIEDIKLDDAVPHVVLKEHPWRRLKTGSSTRLVPLVGASLWAAERIVDQVQDSRTDAGALPERSCS